MASVGVLQHFWAEHADTLDTALKSLGHETTLIRLWDNDLVPAAGDFDGWLVMGGPMNVDEIDKHPYLLHERQLLAELIAADAPVIGICLGAQLLARAAEARVYPKRPKEIGLFDIELTEHAAADPLFSLMSNPQEVFQWHGDTFDLPAGAIHLARSRRYEHQAFRLGRRVYAMQFHLECSVGALADIEQACAAELAQLSPDDDFAKCKPRLPTSLAAQQKLAHKMVERWTAMF